MSSSIPKRLYGPAQVSNAAATKYTVPTSVKTIIRQISIQNPSGSAVTFTLSIGADAAGVRLFDAFSIPAAGVGVTGNIIDRGIYWPMVAAEIIQAFAGTNNILVLAIFGDEQLAA